MHSSACGKAQANRDCLKCPKYCCCFLPSETLLQSECMHAYSVNPPPKREVQLVDHLNNTLNNSTVIAAKKATVGLEPDQQLARRNSKFSICAAENAASICMTNGTFVEGREGRPGPRGHTSREGRCHAATDQPSAALRSPVGATTVRAGTQEADAGLHVHLCQMT